MILKMSITVVIVMPNGVDVMTVIVAMMSMVLQMSITMIRWDDDGFGWYDIGDDQPSLMRYQVVDEGFVVW